MSTTPPAASDQQATARITLVGKPGCHLCDTAREVVAAVAAQTGTTWTELSILDDPALAEQYWDQIPVVLVDGAVHDYWRVDADRLRSALAGQPWWRGSRRLRPRRPQAR